MFVVADLLGQLLVDPRLGDVPWQVRQPVGEPAEHGVVDLLAGVLDVLARHVAQLVDGDLVGGHADDRTLQGVASFQPVQSAEGHLLGQVTGDAEDDHDVAVVAHRAYFHSPSLRSPQPTAGA